MATCAQCGTQVSSPFTCSYCGRKHCTEHRLPEKHTCPFLSTTRTLGPEFRIIDADNESDESTESKNNNAANGRSGGHRPTPPDTQPHRPTGDPWKDPSDRPSAMDDVPTLGTRKPEPTAPSPDTEVKSDTKTSKRAAATAAGSLVLLPFHRLHDACRVFATIVYNLSIGIVKTSIPIVLVGLLLAGAIASGALSAGDYLGETGSDIDTEVREAVWGNESKTLGAPNGTAQTPATVGETPVATDDEDSGGWLSGLGGEELNHTELEQLVHEEINERRRDRGLRELRFDSALQEIARYHSENMAEADTLSHTLDSQSMGDRYDNFGYDCRVEISSNRYMTGAENILYTYYRVPITGSDGEKYFDTPEALAEGIADQWMNSEGHRENILRPYWNNEGIGIYVEDGGGETQVWATQNFC